MQVVYKEKNYTVVHFVVVQQFQCMAVILAEGKLELAKIEDLTVQPKETENESRRMGNADTTDSANVNRSNGEFDPEIKSSQRVIRRGKGSF